MTEKSTLIDSDIFISILRQEKPTYANAKKYLQLHGKFKISCLTYFECLRGYKTVQATKKLKAFQQMLAITEVLYLNEMILNRASEIYAFLHKQGRLTGEFDLLIGVTALVNDWKLTTNNERHYLALKDFFGLEIENWLTLTL